MANSNEKKQQAQFLYMAGGKTQKEIADLVGVCERTIYSWVHQFAWDKLRLAAFQAPATIADNLCAQIVELQNTIAAREPGNRFPTLQEAEVTRKLMICLEKAKKYPSLSQHMQVLETFRNYIRPINKDFARDLGKYTDMFISEKSVNGYAPYQVEYGVDAVSPIMPGYDEAPGMDANEPPPYRPCLDGCLHPGNCTYSDCMRRPVREVTVDDYKVSPVAFIHSNAKQTKNPGPESPANSEHSTLTGSNPAIPGVEIDNKTPLLDIQKNSENSAPTGSDPAISQPDPATLFIIDTGIDPTSKAPIHNAPLKKFLPFRNKQNKNNNRAA